VSLASALLAEVSEQDLARFAEALRPYLPARQATTPERLLTVGELADRLNVSSEWVRRHQAELGGYRLSDGGGQNPVRFRESEVETFLAERRLRPTVRSGRNGWREDPDWALR
jgi:excisionase family DNA binding protein